MIVVPVSYCSRAFQMSSGPRSLIPFRNWFPSWRTATNGLVGRVQTHWPTCRNKVNRNDSCSSITPLTRISEKFRPAIDLEIRKTVSSLNPLIQPSLTLHARTSSHDPADTVGSTSAGPLPELSSGPVWRPSSSLHIYRGIHTLCIVFTLGKQPQFGYLGLTYHAQLNSVIGAYVPDSSIEATWHPCSEYSANSGNSVSEYYSNGRPKDLVTNIIPVSLR
jgi:hypothetical protein